MLLCFEDGRPYMLAEIAVLLEKGAVTPNRQLAVRPRERDVIQLRALHLRAYFGRRAYANLHSLSHEVFFAAVFRGMTEALRQDRREPGS